MKKFKDFIYDKNDIIIAVLILVAAALIICWRVNVILEYPKQLLGNDGNPAVENPVDNVGDADKPSDGGDNSDAANNIGSDAGNVSDTAQTGDDQQAAGNQQTSDDSQELPLWQGGVLTRDVEVEVTGNSASAAIQCLIDKGLFDDYAEYQTICDDSGLDHEKVKAGTFTFTKGATKKDIAKKMNWG